MSAEDKAWRRFFETRPDTADVMAKARKDGVAKLFEVADADENGPDEIAILCGSSAKPGVGAKRARCECGTWVWLSPATQELMAQHKDHIIHLLCSRCVERKRAGVA